MIKLNTPYKLENGDHVVFTEGKKGTINGKHSEATLTGTLEGNVLKATFHNTKVNATGLMEITFLENGFDAKWKSGLEPGPMRGKWQGKLISSNSDIKTESKNDVQSSLENVSDLDIYIRYSDGNEEVGYFSIEIESELKLPNEISYESLTHLISYYGLYEDENFLKAVKNETSEFSLRMSDCPQIFITRINNLDLKPLYDYHFNEEENEESVATLLNINTDEVSDFLSDYFQETAYSVENLY
jgi:hypothetical protein